MSSSDVIAVPGREAANDDPEARIASVRAGLDSLDARLARLDGEQVTGDERGMLVTLVLSLDETIRDIEGLLVPDGVANGGRAGRRSRFRIRSVGDTRGATVDVEAEYRADLTRRLKDLRSDLDERAGRILFVTGGGGRRRERWTDRLALGGPTAPGATPGAALTTGAGRTAGLRGLAALRSSTAFMLAVGKALTVVGVVALLFLVFEFGMTGVLEARDQRTLLAKFQLDLPSTKLGVPNRPIPPGSPVAILDIPRIHLGQVVMEGTTTQLLKQGPGHFRVTPIPGEFGNAVIAGHRTAYGAPFRDLDALRPGDTITATTGQGAFTYIVKLLYHVRPGQPDVFAGSADSRLTLITADPAYAARGRLAVVALLRGDPVAIDARPPVAVGGNELGLSADPIGAALALVWAQLLFLAVWGARRLYRRWNGPVTYLLATPVILALLLLTFENLDRLLPGTL